MTNHDDPDNRLLQVVVGAIGPQEDDPFAGHFLAGLEAGLGIGVHSPSLASRILAATSRHVHHGKVDWPARIRELEGIVISQGVDLDPKGALLWTP